MNPHQNKKLIPLKVLLIKPNGYMNEQGVYIKSIRDSIDSEFPIDSRNN
jgi:hypothetical protein